MRVPIKIWIPNFFWKIRKSGSKLKLSKILILLSAYYLISFELQLFFKLIFPFTNLNESHLSVQPLPQRFSNIIRYKNHLQALLKPRSVGPTLGFWFSRSGVRPIICISHIFQPMLQWLKLGSHFENQCLSTQCRTFHIKWVQEIVKLL